MGSPERDQTTKSSECPRIAKGEKMSPQGETGEPKLTQKWYWCSPMTDPLCSLSQKGSARMPRRHVPGQVSSETESLLIGPRLRRHTCHDDGPRMGVIVSGPRTGMHGTPGLTGVASARLQAPLVPEPTSTAYEDNWPNGQDCHSLSSWENALTAYQCCTSPGPQCHNPLHRVWAMVNAPALPEDPEAPEIDSPLSPVAGIQAGTLGALGTSGTQSSAHDF